MDHPSEQPAGPLDRAESLVLIAIMAALFALVTLQVGARLAEQPPVWTEEVSRYLMVWLMLFGAAVCIRHDEHVGFTLLADSLGPRVGRALRRFAYGVTFALMLILLFVGGSWVAGLIRSGQRTITFDFPIYWVGLALPVAGLLGAWHAARHMLRPAPPAPDPLRAGLE